MGSESAGVPLKTKYETIEWKSGPIEVKLRLENGEPQAVYVTMRPKNPTSMSWQFLNLDLSEAREVGNLLETALKEVGQ